MNIRRKSQVDDFERRDGDDDIEGDIDSAGPQSKNGVEYPITKTSDHYRAVKESHSVKAIAKAKKLVKKSRYTSLDGAFPDAVVVNNYNNKKKSTIDLTGPSGVSPTYVQSNANFSTVTDSETRDEFYFDANFEDVEDPRNSDHYFEAIFDDDCKDASYPVTSPKIHLEENFERSNAKANLPTKNGPDKGNDDCPNTPNTLASSSISGDSRPTDCSSTPDASVSPSTSADDSSFNISTSSKEMSTSDTSLNQTTKKKFRGRKYSSYQKLDNHSASDEKIQLELDQRLRAIHKLKDVTIEQNKKIKKMELSNKADKLRLILFRKEITYLRLKNADLGQRVTKLEDDLERAKDDAIVSEEEANRMCTALVLIREQIDEAENRTEKLDENVEVEDLFAGGEG